MPPSGRRPPDFAFFNPFLRACLTNPAVAGFSKNCVQLILNLTDRQVDENEVCCERTTSLGCGSGERAVVGSRVPVRQAGRGGLIRGLLRGLSQALRPGANRREVIRFQNH